jgi:predicted permease
MLQDLRHAIRALGRTPAVTAVTIAVLTLGIGATTAIFSVVDAIVFRGLPFHQADRLVSITTRDLSTGALTGANAPQDFLDWNAQQDVFETLAATATGGGFVLRGEGRPENLRVLRTTASLFDVLRVQPALGRVFTKDHEVDGNHRVAVISDALWRSRFGSDPAIVGKRMTFDFGAWEIVGVMPPGFTYPIGQLQPTELWVPLRVPAAQRTRGTNRSYYLQIAGRLRGDVTVAQADERMAAITAALALQHPAWFTNRTSAVRPLHELLVGGARPWMLMLLGAVGIVLLIACVNVANLMLARAMARVREIGVRTALGASRWQLVRGLLAESLVLSTAGTACAVVAAWWSMDLLKAALPATLPRGEAVAVNLRVLAAASALAVLTGLLVGLAPAVQFSRPSLIRFLRDGGAATAGRGRQNLRATLVVVEVALAVVLLICAGLFASSFARLVKIDMGFEHRNVLTATVRPRMNASDPADWERVKARLSVAIPQILERVRSMPGVEAAAFTAAPPLSPLSFRSEVQVRGAQQPFRGEDSVEVRQVTPDYGRVMRTRLVRGRYLTADDAATSQQVVVLNEEAGKRYFPFVDPLGATITIDVDRTVVGVVANARLDGPEKPLRPEAYVPAAQSTPVGGDLVVRTAGDPQALAHVVREAVWTSIPDASIPETTSMQTVLDRFTSQRRLNMLIVGLFGFLGLVIAAVGIYGVTSYTVVQRTQEIGVRMALGARRSRILTMVLAAVSLLLLTGLAIGVVGAWLLTGLLESFLFDVAPHDPAVFAAGAVVLFTSGFVAALVPALRASRVAPLIALRTE